MASRFKRIPLQHQEKEKSSDQNVMVTLLKQARKSGILNLSNRALGEVPESVWRLNQEVPGGGKSLSMDDTGDSWWDQVDLVKLILASNNLIEVSKNISNFPALSHLDLHDNKLGSLPEAVGGLTDIVKLNISQNSFDDFPSCILRLKKLKCLHIQQNKIKEIPDSFGDLNCLEDLDLSENEIKSLPDSIESLTKLKTLRASQNQLGVVTPAIGSLKDLKSLDLRQNRISQLPQELGRLKRLDILYLQMNQISKFPQLDDCSNLKELYLGKNCIKEMPADCINSLTSLVTLDLRENQLKIILNEISSLQCLERLDLTNNDLSNVPNVLGRMVNLKSILLDGNPLRSIRRDLLSRGTTELKKYLVSRMSSAESSPSSSSSHPSSVRSSDSGIISVNKDVIDEVTLKSTKSLDLSNKKLPGDPSNLFILAVKCGVTQVNCSKNLLTSLPEGLMGLRSSLVELNLSFNRISYLHPAVGSLGRLMLLNLSNNLLSELPLELNNLKLLREINISFNRFTKMPEVLYEMEALETISISDNKVESFDAVRLCGLSRLSTLDLQNNNLSALNPLMGRCTQLQHCKLEGNSFRNPGFSILSKGTAAVLEYLRDKIVD